MAIKLEDQTLPVSELFKKYDLDEISELLVNLKKEVFVRTNDIKKVIGSNPELMIKFGENVLDIYNSSKTLGNGVSSIVSDIKLFSSSLGEKMLEISRVELPNDISCEEIFDRSQELMQEEYLGILEEFSKRNFVLAYELYLRLRDSDIYNKGGVVENLGSDLETKLGLDFFNYDLDFVRKNIKSYCYSLIQGCIDLNGAELSQLILIRFLFENEENDSSAANNGVYSRFEKVIRNSIFLRMDETKEYIDSIVLDSGGNGAKCEECCEYFTIGVQTLMGFYELSDSLCNVIAEFENNNWIDGSIKAELLRVVNNKNGILAENPCIDELRSAIISKFSAIRGSIDIEENEYSHKTLIKIYSDIYDKVLYNKKGMEFINSNLFPELLSEIDHCLRQFLRKDQKDQLLRLIIVNEGSHCSSCRKSSNTDEYNTSQTHFKNEDCGYGGELSTPCFNGAGNSSYYNSESFNWLNSKGRNIEFLINEFCEIEAFLNKVLHSNELVKSTISYLSYSCLFSNINNYVRFCKNLFWSFFRSNGVKRTPKPVNTNNVSEQSFVDGLNAFTNTLIQGRCLDVIENGLQKYLGCNNKEEKSNLETLKTDGTFYFGSDCDQDDDKLQYYPLQSFVSDFKYEQGFDINWRILLEITCEILISIDYYVNFENYSDDHNGNEMIESFVLLKPLNTFFKRYIDKEQARTHLDKLKTLEMIIYSIILHSDKLNVKAIVFQSMLCDNNFDIDSACEKPARLSEIGSRMISYYSLYRECKLEDCTCSEEDNSDTLAVTPHSVLIEMAVDIISFGLRLHSRMQRSDYNEVCKYYLYTYITPLLYDNIMQFSNLKSKCCSYSGSTGENSKTNSLDGDLSDSVIATLNRILLSLFADLTWCHFFNIDGVSTGEMKCKGNSSEYDTCFEIMGETITKCGIGIGSTGKSEVPKLLDTIKNNMVCLLCDIQKPHNFETNVDSKNNISTKNAFATFVQRFQASSHLKPSKYGSLSNFIAAAYDRDLKIDIDRNSISREARSNSINFREDVSNTDLSLGRKSESLMMTHFSDIMAKYKEEETKFVRSDDNAGNLFYNQSLNEHESGKNIASTYNNRTDGRISGIMNMNININGKIDTQSIWQVSNLLKETVKDKVFGQKEDA
ncbi:hypothetical protein FG386_000115 [Cryptosporidium ryanae]|uniref:uncharacterized protein n=1 Tax=Cryptosporidium ryanae TaxID=515981 RepID=UPI003519D91C|nr:hypothetical protein FG386_000115 [Cryptosporidium ryanae]